MDVTEWTRDWNTSLAFKFSQRVNKTIKQRTNEKKKQKKQESTTVQKSSNIPLTTRK